MFHVAEHEVLATLLDDCGEGVQQLDAVPLLVVVAALDQVRLVDGRRLSGLAVLERELVGHVFGSLDGLELAGLLHLTGADLESVELVATVKNKRHLDRQFPEPEHRKHDAFTGTHLAVGLVAHLHDFFDDSFTGSTERNPCELQFVIALGEHFHRKCKHQQQQYVSKLRH